MVFVKHFVVIAEWCVDYEEGYVVVGVYHTLEEAMEAFRCRVESDEKLLADEYGYEFYSDSDRLFDAGLDGYYSQDHLRVSIEEVESEV